MESNTICLIGGMGFLGSGLRAYFKSIGFNIIVVGRGTEVVSNPNERYYASKDLHNIKNELAGSPVQAVIDLSYANISSVAISTSSDRAANLDATRRHLEFSSDIGAGIHAFVSSGGTVYGHGTSQPKSESDPTNPVSSYGVTKLECEDEVRAYSDKNALPFIILRPSNIFGPGQVPFRGQGLIATAFGAALEGRPLTVFGDGSQVRDYLFIRDFCEGVSAALHRGRSGATYNVGSGKGVSVSVLLEKISNVVKTEGKTLAISWQATRPFDVKHNVLNHTSLTNDSGWRPVTKLDRGLATTWEWVRSQ